MSVADPTLASFRRTADPPQRQAARSPRRLHADLKSAVATWERARHDAVVLFAEVMRRRAYRELGYSSIQQYARTALGFSDTRTGDFVRLARRLDALPNLRAAVARGEVGYTKAREIVAVASPRTERRWVDEARSSTRAELVVKVKRAQRRARDQRRRRSQPELLPAAGAGACEAPAAACDDATDVPVRVTLEMTPEQYARYEALVARLTERGCRDRVEVLLQGLAASLAPPTGAPVTTSSAVTPRGAPVQVVVQTCPECGRASVPTARGELAISGREADRLKADSRVSQPGRRNVAAIPPGIRRAVIERDRGRCTAPGCRNTHFLHVHHRVPRAQGGDNSIANLITLCAGCHRLWHERRGRPPEV